MPSCSKNFTHKLIAHLLNEISAPSSVKRLDFINNCKRPGERWMKKNFKSKNKFKFFTPGRTEIPPKNHDTFFKNGSSRIVERKREEERNDGIGADSSFFEGVSGLAANVWLVPASSFFFFEPGRDWWKQIFFFPGWKKKKQQCSVV